MNLIILDRDGVINFDSPQHIKSADEWKPIPGSLEAIARLTQSGYRIVIATNQSGIGRGLFDMDDLNAIHEKMLKAISALGGHIDAIFYCPHPADSDCRCRKPKPGMFHDISARFNADLTDVPAVGDSMRDLEAAKAVGCQPILVLTGKGEHTSKENDLPSGTLKFSNLSAAVDFILGGARA
jgi:D-glycero-D-manno-heptose 1,7-bisphosphate phosphatase